MKKKLINLLLSGFMFFYASAQTAGYKFYSLLDSVKTSGFYNIELTPELNAHLKTDYSDIRIINSSNKWVPHILRNPASEGSDTQLSMDFKFTKTENTRLSTTLEIENRGTLISNINLVIRNTAAERFCTLSGSDDRAHWFIINDSILLNPVAAETRSENTFGINFPPSSYKFFKLIIHNNNKDPFDIKGVIQLTSAVAMLHLKNKFINNPAPHIQQKDSGKISYIKITQQQPYQFDNISLQLTGVKYYNRKIDLYIPYADKNSFSNPGQLLQSFTASNNSTLTFNIPLTKCAVFYLLINNEDNLPLTVQAVKTAISNHYITTYLEAGNNYRLIMDNEAAVMPDYDLVKLNSKIPDSISFLHFEKITAFAENNAVAKVAKNNKWILWIAIAGALVILLLFTYKMLTEVDKRKNT
jgi:hypothetical protein